MNQPRQRTLVPDRGALQFKFAPSYKPWAGAWLGVLVLAYLVISERISLTMAAGSSVSFVGLLVLATVRNRAKLIFMFFLNSCLLIVAKRDVGGVDIAVLSSLLTGLLLVFSFASNKNTCDPLAATSPGNRRFDLTQSLLIGFAVLSIISTWANSQSLITVLPWLSGIIFALLIDCAPFSQLPSFSTARRAILAGGAVTTAYDLYLLGTGKALNVGTFNAGRFLGSLGDYELLAEFYGAIILLALTAVFFDESRVWRVASGALMVPGILIILATQSRGPVILLCGVAPVLILISAFQFRESTGKILALVGVMALIFGASFGALSATPLFERFSSIQLGEGIETTINRAGVWDYFTQLPKFVDLNIVGNGFDYPYEVIGTFPHSLYLWLLWSGGPALLICFAVLACLLLGRLFRGVAFRHSGSLSAAAVVIYVLLDEVKIEAARTSPTVGLLWVFLSLAVLASREQREL